MGFNKTIFLLSLISFIFLSPSVFAAQLGDFTYEESGGTITITAYTGAGGAVIIPDTIEGKPVVSIGGGAFGYSYGLTSIVLPGSLVSIGSFAFAYCSGLTGIVFPDNLASIGNYAFAECMGLTSMGIIPAGVTSIGEAVFSSCRGLTSITSRCR